MARLAANGRRRILSAAMLLPAVVVLGGRAQDAALPPEKRVVSQRTVSMLHDALRSEDRSQRSQSLAALRELKAAGPGEAVLAQLGAAEAAIRCDAVLAAEAMLPAGQLAEPLGRACQDESPRVARHAIAVLSRAHGDAAQQALLAAGSQMGGAGRSFWARALVRRGEAPSAAILRELLDQDDDELRAAGAALLARHPGVVPLEQRVALLRDGGVLVRVGAVQSLRAYLEEPAAYSATVAATRDRSPYVRRAALQLLLGQTPELQQLAPLARDADSTVRRAALDVIATAGASAIPLLIERLGDEELLVARRAAKQLAEMGTDPVAAALSAQLQDAGDQAVAEAARALGLMQRGDAVDALLRLLQHRAAEVRAAAFEALGRIGDARAVPPILARMPREQGRARRAANIALGAIGDGRAVAHLLRDVHYPDGRSMGINPTNFIGGAAPYPPPYPEADTAVASAAVRSLGQIGDSVAVAALTEIAADVLRNDEFWSNVAWSLGELGDPSAAPALEQLGIVGGLIQGTRQVDMPDGTRIAALRTIGKLQLGELAADVLQMAPVRCSNAVRRQAAQVLTSLTGQRYAFRPRARLVEFFLRDLGTAEDEALTQPICYPVGN